MNNHGLGHLPQPDNFTTIGNNLGIEINQYNCPINVSVQSKINHLTFHLYELIKQGVSKADKLV